LLIPFEEIVNYKNVAWRKLIAEEMLRERFERPRDSDVMTLQVLTPAR